MFALLIGAAHAGPPPCDVEVVDAMARLSATLDAIRPGLVALLPDLAPLDPPALLVADDGTAVGPAGLARPTCALPDGRPVVVRRATPIPGGGHATWTAAGGVLSVGTYDPTRDPWDEIGWRAIVAHEWVHLHHFARARPASLRFRVRPLVRRLARDPLYHDAVLELAQAAWARHERCDDATGLVAAWDTAVGLGSPDLSAWMAVEGMARSYQVSWEEAARGRDPQASDFAACRTFEPEDHGYSVGCLVALALDRCAGPTWRDGVWSGGFGPAIDRLRE